MTKEKALELINHKLDLACDDALIMSDVEYEVLQICAKALEQEPFINKPCVSSEVCEHDKQKVLDKIKAQIYEEAAFAYADFDRYKEEVLYADADELPDDDFRFGMLRCIEIINRYKQ